MISPTSCPRCCACEFMEVTTRRRLGRFAKGRIRPDDRVGRLVHVQEERAHAGCSLHPAGLCYEQVGSHAMLGLDPAHARAVLRGAEASVVGDTTHHAREFVARDDAVQREEPFAHATVATTLTDVVPEARPSL